MTKKSDFTPEQWDDLSPIIRERIENGQSVSAINDLGNDDNLWEFDEDEESRLADDHMAQLRVQAAELAD